MKIKFTFWKLIFLALMAAGLYGTVVRFTQGLGRSTNLNDQFPWGLWIGFDVLCGVMLAAGGFTLTAAVHIFNIKRLRPIVRPTILTAFLGYVLVCIALMYDLGRPYRIWHPLVMRNPHSVMFEVAYCVMLYTTVLSLEFSPIVLERFNLQKPLKIVRAALIPLVILGVILSTLHQSSLGTVYLIMPEKLHPLWYSPLLPVFFFMSAIAVGLAMTIFESSLSAKYFGRQLELPILQELGRVLVVVLCVYGILRFEDLLHRGVLKMLWQPGYEMYLFWLEISLSLVSTAAGAVAKEDANDGAGTLPGGGAGGAGIHHEPAECEHHGAGVGRGCALHAEVDRNCGDGRNHRGRVRTVWTGGQVFADLPRGREPPGGSDGCDCSNSCVRPCRRLNQFGDSGTA